MTGLGMSNSQRLESMKEKKEKLFDMLRDSRSLDVTRSICHRHKAVHSPIG